MLAAAFLPQRKPPTRALGRRLSRFLNTDKLGMSDEYHIAPKDGSG